MAPSQCSDKARLLSQYTRSVNAWTLAVRSLRDLASLNRCEYAVLVAQIAEAKTVSANAKAAYSAHLAEHGC